MSDTTFTTLQIDADTSGADRFEQGMNRAGGAAKSFFDEQRAGALALAGVGTAMIGVITGGGQLLEYVSRANRDLADLNTMANRVGISLADLQGLQFGGMIAGLSSDQINGGLQRSAELLNDASRNANSLSKELAANGLSVRNSNGSLITQNQLLGIAADLISRARNPGDQEAIAKMLGFSREWVPLLQQGSVAMSRLTDEAQKAGAVIDDATIERATDFDRQWRKSSVEFSTYMKAAISGLLPFIDDLIERAGKFAKTVNVDKIERLAQDQLNFLADQVQFDANKDIKFEVTPETQRALSDYMNATSMLEGIVSGFRSLTSSVRTVPALLPESQDPMSSSSYGKATGPTSIEQIYKRWDAEQDAAQDAVRNYSRVAGTGTDGNDRVDTAINTLRRHTEQQLADARAIGEGAGQLALFRAQAAETAAVLANGGKETAEQARLFKELQARAYDAAVALERAKVANDISRGQQTRFLSQSDVEIANQLKGLYPDVAQALNSVEAAAIRSNGAFRSMSNVIENNLTTGITDAISGAKSFGQAMSDTGKVVIRAIEEMVIKLLVIRPLMQGLQGAFGGFGFGFGGGAAATGVPGVSGVYAQGGVFDSGNVIPFASGGIIDREMVVPMARMGEAGPEAIVPLRRGPDGNLGIAQQGGASQSVVVHGGDVHITVQGNADERTLAIMKQELAKRDAALKSQVQMIVKRRPSERW